MSPIFLHIGKCGGGTIRSILSKNRLNVQIIHAKGSSLSGVCEKVIVPVRDPVDRYVSAFNWRKNDVPKGKLSKEEKETFETFQTANQMAMALSELGKLKELAEKGFKSVAHVCQPLSGFLGGKDFLENLHLKGAKFYVIETKNLIEDAEREIKKCFDLSQIDTRVKNKHVSTKTPDSTYLTEVAIENLINYYREDYECIKILNMISE